MGALNFILVTVGVVFLLIKISRVTGIVLYYIQFYIRSCDIFKTQTIQGEPYHPEKENGLTKLSTYYLFTLKTNETPLIFDMSRAQRDGTHGLMWYSLDGTVL